MHPTAAHTHHRMFRHSQDGELAVGVSLDNRLRLYDAVRGCDGWGVG